MRTTPFHAIHLSLHASMTDFGGWHMPVMYASGREEHLATRGRAGLFDLSHMGRVFVKGPQRKAFLDHLCTNSIADMEVGRARYSLLCNERGTIIDDVIVYADQDYDMIVINAGNRDKDLAHFREQAKRFQVEIDDRSDAWCLLAIQGPKSQEILQPLTPSPLGDVKYYWGAHVELLGLKMYIARTGYTGEDGFELFFDAKQAEPTWHRLLEAGKAQGLVPVGLGARDTLRLEAGMPLYGHEIDDTTNPLEAGLGWAVKLSKPAFLGKAALEAVKAGPLPRKLVGFESQGKKVPRQGCGIFHQGREVGKVCSGTQAPTVGGNLGTAYVPAELAAPGTALEIDIRGDRYPIVIKDRTFYKRAK